MTNRNFCRQLFMAACCAGAVSAQAQTAPPIKPGLWQIKSERQVDGKKAPDLGEHLQKMSPEMRKRMEANMKQHGVDMSGEPGTMKMCQTKESLAQGRWQGEQGQCKTEFTSRTASAWAWRSTCSQPPSESQGEASFTGPESYTVKSSTKMTLQGQAHVNTMNMSAKWLGADCGDLKPVTLPAQATKNPQPR